MKEKLKAIIHDGEKINTEFKLATDKLPSTILESVCSFLNRFGGIIMLELMIICMIEKEIHT